MNTERKSAWNSLEITKLVVAMLTPLLVAIIGYQISRSFRKADEARAAALIEAQQLQKALEDNRRTSEIRQVAVSNFSKFIYERRVRSELLHSALQRHFANPAEQSKKEIIERKRLYDEAYVLWNANHQANLLLIRQLLGSNTYSDFEGMVEFRLVAKTFAPLDACLTRAYDLAIRDQDPRRLLKECNAMQLIQRSLDCGYAITDELYKLSSMANSASAQAASIVDRRCPTQ